MTAARAALLLAALLLAALACAGPADDTAPAAPPAPPPLVGTWRLLDVAAGDSADTARFGARPQGYLVYDATGHVFVHVRRRPGAGEPRHAWTEASRAHLLEIVESYAASFGRYAVDTTARMVTHAIEGESPPATGVLERATPYELHGDTLRIGGSTLRWTFVRVR